jgi:hypothetical protein
MGGLGDDPSGFDMLAASLRADAADLTTFLDVLGAKLAGALPGMVQLEREGGLFKKQHPVKAIRVSLEDRVYEIRREGARIDARLSHQVRGINLKNEALAVEQWIEALSRHLAEHAESSAAARSALEQLVR